MTSELLKEDVIGLEEARKELPGDPAYSTIWRWAINGVQLRGSKERVKLETVCIGRKRFTTRQAITRFIELRSVV